jgi:hypothetical protein
LENLEKTLTETMDEIGVIQHRQRMGEDDHDALMQRLDALKARLARAYEAAAEKAKAEAEAARE